MEEQKKINRVARSFADALSGLVFAIKTEINFKIELGAAAIVAALMIIFKVTNAEALILIVAITLVLFAEVTNTVVERMMDIIQPEIHPDVKNIKDLMATSVLIVSISALVIGLIVFIPYIYSYV